MAAGTDAWRDRRDARQVGVECHFTTESARIKASHADPKIIE